LVYYSKNERNSRYLRTEGIYFVQLYEERVRG